MEFVLGPILALGTWAAGALVVLALGIVFAQSATGSTHRLAPVRQALWWGLTLAIAVSYSVSLVMPLGSPVALAVIVGAAVLLGLLGLRVYRPRWRIRGIRHWPDRILSLGVLVAVVAVAISAFGAVTHYDAGLYQVSAVRYAADFAAIPGIANLYGPLAYAGWHPLVGGLLSFDPWSDNGFRFLNGFLMTLVAIELIARLTREKKSTGTYVLAIGVVLTWPPLLWMSDYWITSPTPDTAALLVALVTSAYLVDVVTDRGATRDVPTVIVLAVLLATVKPTSLPLAILTVLVAVGIVIRQRGIGNSRLAIAFAVGLGCAVLVLSLVRDAVLSGWLLYPLSIAPLDVTWRAPDPSGLRLATLGFARLPEDMWSATSGWGWLPIWASRLPGQWEFWAVTLAVSASLVLLGYQRITKREVHARLLIAAALPSMVAVFGWVLLSPPAPRFGWPALFSLAAIMLGWALSHTRLWSTVAVSAGVVLTLFALAAATLRFDWPLMIPPSSAGSLGVLYVELPTVAEVERTLESGLRVRVPRDSDQCWAVYPLCTSDPAPKLALQGDGIESGFTQSRTEGSP